MLTNLYIKLNTDLFLDLFVSKKNQFRLFDCLCHRMMNKYHYYGSEVVLKNGNKKD